MAIDAQYASPGLRWGLLQDDYPGANAEYELVTAEKIPGGHPFARDGEKFVLCTIHFPADSDKSPAYGWKPLSEARKQDDESFAALRTKALGRALKDAGYPDKLTDLRALTVWRKRTAEVQALASGHVAEIGEGTDVVAAIEAAAESTPDAAGHDDSAGHDDDVVEAELIDENEHTPKPAAQQFNVGDGFDEKRSDLMEVILGLDEDAVAQLKDFATQNQMQEDLNTWDEEALDHLEAWLDS